MTSATSKHGVFRAVAHILACVCFAEAAYYNLDLLIPRLTIQGSRRLHVFWLLFFTCIIFWYSLEAVERAGLEPLFVFDENHNSVGDGTFWRSVGLVVATALAPLFLGLFVKALFEEQFLSIYDRCDENLGVVSDLDLGQFVQGGPALATLLGGVEGKATQLKLQPSKHKASALFVLTLAIRFMLTMLSHIGLANADVEYMYEIHAEFVKRIKTAKENEARHRQLQLSGNASRVKGAQRREVFSSGLSKEKKRKYNRAGSFTQRLRRNSSKEEPDRRPWQRTTPQLAGSPGREDGNVYADSDYEGNYSDDEISLRRRDSEDDLFDNEYQQLLDTEDVDLSEIDEGALQNQYVAETTEACVVFLAQLSSMMFAKLRAHAVNGIPHAVAGLLRNRQVRRGWFQMLGMTEVVLGGTFLDRVDSTLMPLPDPLEPTGGVIHFCLTSLMVLFATRYFVLPFSVGMFGKSGVAVSRRARSGVLLYMFLRFIANWARRHTEFEAKRLRRALRTPAYSRSRPEATPKSSSHEKPRESWFSTWWKLGPSIRNSKKSSSRTHIFQDQERYDPRKEDQSLAVPRTPINYS